MQTEKLTFEQRRNLIESLVKRGRKTNMLSLDRDSGISLTPSEKDINDELETLAAFKLEVKRENECDMFYAVVENT